MEFMHNDGGRALAGYKGNTGDCGCRAIAIVTGMPYQEVYDLVKKYGEAEKPSKKNGKKSHPRTGIFKPTMRKIMQDLGWVWHPTMGIGTGCTVHLADGELPMGRLVVAVSKHYTAVIDGVIHDTYNPSERAATLYSPHHDSVPKGAEQMDNGFWKYEPKRCVYGYWSKQD